MTPSRMGGMGAPNIRLYYRAVLLDQLKSWWTTSTQSNWKQIESVILTKDPKLFLSALLLDPTPGHFPLDTITASLRVWSAIPQMLKGTPQAILSRLSLNSISLITPVIQLQPWINAGIDTIGNLFNSAGLLSFANLQTKYGLSTNTFYVYLRIRSLLTKTHWITQDTILHPLIQFYDSPNKQLKGISHIYDLLSQSSDDSIQKQITFWSTHITSVPSLNQWYKALSLPLRLSHCITHWESLQKLFQQWYYTPTRLSKIYPNTSHLCWRNCGLPGTLLHIWWECPTLQNFWTQMQTLLRSITHMTTDLSSVDFLLGLAIPTWPSQFQTVATHILIAARLAIARKWKSSQPPSLQDVITTLNNQLKMEYFFSKAKLSTAKFYNTWEPWLMDSRSINLDCLS